MFTAILRRHPSSNLSANHAIKTGTPFPGRHN
ncbi:unknown [Prevotella sp. CAG:873]|nr:unknown [Prevotella sp. CAG:873]